MQELKRLEDEHPELITPDSPTQRVGAAPVEAFGVVEHRIPLLSLGNAFSNEDLMAWHRRTLNLLGGEHLDFVCEIKMEYWARALELVGENVTMVHEGDDLAGQDRLLIAPELYRDFLKPRHTRLFEFIRKHAATDVKIFYHSCGAVAALIPDLIESGIDILNPVQVNAADMDTRRLKRLYGKEITFYGGGVDTQRVLPRGTPAEVRAEVRRRIDDLAPGGGFIFATVHNIQADVPPENIEAMWETLQEFGVYH